MGTPSVWAHATICRHFPFEIVIMKAKSNSKRKLQKGPAFALPMFVWRTIKEDTQASATTSYPS